MSALCGRSSETGRGLRRLGEDAAMEMVKGMERRADVFLLSAAEKIDAGAGSGYDAAAILSRFCYVQGHDCCFSATVQQYCDDVCLVRVPEEAGTGY